MRRRRWLEELSDSEEIRSDDGSAALCDGDCDCGCCCGDSLCWDCVVLVDPVKNDTRKYRVQAGRYAGVLREVNDVI